MCGIVGLIDWTNNRFNLRDEALFKTLLLVNSLRGSVSTGVFGIDKTNHTFDFAKTVGSPFMFLGVNHTKRFFNKMNNRYMAVIGHGRYATRGDIKPANAHPFFYEGWGLVHNGTISNLATIQKRHSITGEVDSEVVLKLISKVGLPEAIDQIDGAFAFVIYHEPTHKMYIIRNKERPLWMAERKDKEQLIIASEEGFIRFSTDREAVEINKPVEFQEGRLYTFNFLDKKTRWESEELEKVSTNAWDRVVYTPPQRFEDEQATTELDMWYNAERRAADAEAAQRRATVNGTPKSVPLKSVGPQRVQVGERVYFFPLEAKTMAPQAGQNNEAVPRTFIKGTLFSDTQIGVVGVVSGDFSPYLSEDFLSGKVELIHYLAGVNGDKLRITVGDLRPEKLKEMVANEKKVVLPPERTETVELLDGMRLSRQRFGQLVEAGCQSCKATITPEMAGSIVGKTNHTTGGFSLLCPSCTMYANMSGLG